MFHATARKSPAPGYCTSTSLPPEQPGIENLPPQPFEPAEENPPSPPTQGSDPCAGTCNGQGGINQPRGLKLFFLLSLLMKKHQLINVDD